MKTILHLIIGFGAGMMFFGFVLMASNKHQDQKEKYQVLQTFQVTRIDTADHKRVISAINKNGWYLYIQDDSTDFIINYSELFIVTKK